MASEHDNRSVDAEGCIEENGFKLLFWALPGLTQHVKGHGLFCAYYALFNAICGCESAMSSDFSDLSRDCINRLRFQELLEVWRAHVLANRSLSAQLGKKVHSHVLQDQDVNLSTGEIHKLLICSFEIFPKLKYAMSHCTVRVLLKVSSLCLFEAFAYLRIMSDVLE